VVKEEKRSEVEMLEVDQVAEQFGAKAHKYLDYQPKIAVRSNST
jgi:hypothetical protein